MKKPAAARKKKNKRYACMKMRKVMMHNQLVMEVINQLVSSADAAG